MVDLTFKELQAFNDAQREIIEKQQAEIDRLRSGTRCPHCDELRLELGEARGEIERLREEFLAERKAWENVVAEKHFEIERLRGNGNGLVFEPEGVLHWPVRR